MSHPRLKLPINLKVLIPLTENMPDGKSTKPGDVVIAKNGKTIQVDNTDAEGRLILADALCYADTFKVNYVQEYISFLSFFEFSVWCRFKVFDILRRPQKFSTSSTFYLTLLRHCKNSSSRLRSI